MNQDQDLTSCNGWNFAAYCRFSETSLIEQATMGRKQVTRIMQKLCNKIFVVIHYSIKSPKNTF